MSSSITIIGGAVLAVLLAGYLAQQYGLPAPLPKIAGIDLGTTFSSIGIYQAVTGETDVLQDEFGKSNIPSVVGFLNDGTILVGNMAVQQQETNSRNTIYDAKRFIGKKLRKDDAMFKEDLARYPFTIKLDDEGFVYFEVEQNNEIKKITPEFVGSIIIAYLRRLVEKKYNTVIKEIVLSVPAEFDALQRKYTTKAAELAGVNVRRIITEPTAAALAYGLHKKTGVEYITVVDFGGGTLDISVLWINGGVFITQSMAGNNRLGGQDFNDQVLKFLLEQIHQKHNVWLTDKADLQHLRLGVENAKIQLSTLPETWVQLRFNTVLDEFKHLLRRREFEDINENLFASVLDPILAALAECKIKPEDVDEVVLVGGSTRIPKVRNVVGTFFGKAPNYGVDPELAVVTGVAIQAGVLSGGWPLQVSAIELPNTKRKTHNFKTRTHIH